MLKGSVSDQFHFRRNDDDPHVAQIVAAASVRGIVDVFSALSVLD
jgi:hypothetical protein